MDLNQSVVEFLKAVAKEQNGVEENVLGEVRSNVSDDEIQLDTNSKGLKRKNTSIDFGTTSSLDVILPDRPEDKAHVGAERIQKCMEKLKAVFNLSTDDTLVAEFSCSLISCTLLKGYMYLTNHHVCFFASTNREKLSNTERSGFLHMKTGSSRLFSTYWFVLRDEVLSYYANATDIYYPLDVIDLRYVVSLEEDNGKNTIHIVTPEKSITLQADTSIAIKEWGKDIVDVMYVLRNGDSIKLAIAFEHIVDVEVTSSFDQHDSLCIRCFQDESAVTIDEYYFTYFHDTRQVCEQILEHLPDLERLHHSSTGSTSNQEKSSLLSKGVSEIASIFNKIHFTDSNTNRESARPDSFEFRFHQHDAFEEDHEKGHWWIPPIPTFTRKHRSPKQKEHELRKLFALPPTEKLLKSFTGALLRRLPVRGKIYVSDHHVFYKSKVIGNHTKVLVPFDDVHEIRKRPGSMIFSYGVHLLTISQIDIVLAFTIEDVRDEFFDLISSILKRSKTRPGNIRKQSMIYEQTPEMPRDTINTVPSLSYPIFETKPVVHEPKSLHITCLTIGTRGDVQPYIALCKGLMKHNHRCRIATHGEYKSWIESHGIEFREVAGDPAELIRLCVDNGMFSIAFFKEGVSKFRGWLDELLVTAWKACQGTDMLIESPSAMAGVHIAEKLDIPFYSCFTMPWTRTRSYPHPFAVPDHHIGGGYNYMTYVFLDQVFWKATSWQINRWRKSHLNLPPTTPEKLAIDRTPFLYCFSSEVVPPVPDWPDWIHLCGYWFLDNPDQSWEPPQSLLDFLKIEPKPVYIGFGSIVVQDPDQMTHVIIEGIRKAGVRAIVSKGWSSRLQKEGKVPTEKTEFPDFIYSLDSAPHDWLFPKMAGVMHHGGAGTTSAGIRAGIPTVVKPFFGDQFFWGNRVQELGIGLWLKKFTVERIAEALLTITTDTKMIKRSQLIGTRIRAEDGVENAINYIFRDYELARHRVPKLEDEASKSPPTLNFEASSDEEDYAQC